MKFLDHVFELACGKVFLDDFLRHSFLESDVFERKQDASVVCAEKILGEEVEHGFRKGEETNRV